MKRKISILSIAVSVFVLLTLAILPHHHHGGLACPVMEFCKQDNAYNDVHTHHHIPVGQDGDSSCIIENGFIVTPSGVQMKNRDFSCKTDKHNYIYVLVGYLFDFWTDDFLSDVGPGEYISFYKSAETYRFQGLRAPPVIFSEIQA